MSSTHSGEIKQSEGNLYSLFQCQLHTYFVTLKSPTYVQALFFFCLYFHINILNLGPSYITIKFQKCFLLPENNFY